MPKEVNYELRVLPNEGIGISRVSDFPNHLNRLSLLNDHLGVVLRKEEAEEKLGIYYFLL